MDGILLLYNNLSLKILSKYCSGRKVYLLESYHEFQVYRHHKKKLVFMIMSMRKFYEKYKSEYNIEYVKTGDSVEKFIAGSSIKYAIEPNEYRLLNIFKHYNLEVLPDITFICQNFKEWADGKNTLLMENFYRFMRQQTGILMCKNKPVGGKWNFDKANRQKIDLQIKLPEPTKFEPDQSVVSLVMDMFPNNFGEVDPFWLATDHEQANHALNNFLTYIDEFGLYQDFMLDGEFLLFHSGISAYLNIGLLDPLYVCNKVSKLNKRIESVEGFIRQILGWREFVRGVYWLKMPEYVELNYFNHTKKLPDFYWTGDTKMNCVRHCVEVSKNFAYSHHIQRLMITGNLGLLMEVEPKQLHEWYMSVYADAHEWVEIPNTIGMALYADGGIIGTKPYIASANYIDKMSNFCKNCSYDKKQRSGANACPFNYLYWNFINKYKDSLKKNYRMQIPISMLEKISDDEIEIIKSKSIDMINCYSKDKTSS